MSEYIAGSVAAEVVPDARRFAALLGKQVSPAADSLGKKIGQDLADRISRGIRDGLKDGWQTAPAQSRNKGRESGDAFAGAFDREVRTKITAALKALPKARIGASATEAEQKLKDLRADLATLGDKQIGIDIDAGAALAELDRIRIALSRVEADSADIQVKADVASALAQLDRVKVSADEVAAKSPTVRVDADTGAARAQLAGIGSSASFASGGVSSLVLAGAAIAPAIVPAAAAATAALLALGSVAGAAVVGAGVAAAAFSGISGAVKAMGKVQDEAGTRAADAATRQVSSANQIRSAENSLRDARASAAEGAIRSAQAISSAQRGVVDAQRAAADGVQSALARVSAAEETHTRTVEAARRAQMDLSQAREDARRSIEDLKLSLAGGALAERGAVLAVQRAQAALSKQPNDAQTRLDYDEAVQRLEETRVRNQRLAKEKAAADKKGIAGSAQVVAAQERIADANRAETDAAKGVRDAQVAVAKAREEGARRVADAQQRVSQAMASAASQQRQSVSSIERAQASLAAAHASTAAAATKTSAAQRELAQSMEGLSPAGRRFAAFLYGLKGPLQELRSEVQEGFLPGLQIGMESTGKALSPFRGELRAVADVLGDLSESAGRALGSPFWQDVIGTFSGALPGVIRTLGGILGDLATGMAGIAMELWGSGVTGGVLDGMKSLTQRFEDFGTGKTEGLSKFIAYVKENGPKVKDFLIAAGGAIGTIVVALTPAGGVVLDTLTGLFKRIEDMDPAQVQQIAASVIGVMAALKVKSVIDGASGVGQMLGLISKGGPQAALASAGVALALIALGAGAYYAYQNSEDVRTSVEYLSNWFKLELLPQFRIAEGVIRDGLSKALQILNADVGDGNAKWRDLGDIVKTLIVPTAYVVAGALAVLALNVKSVMVVVDLLRAQYKFFGDIMVQVSSLVVRTFLGLVGAIIQGAADAFGWVPEIGDKLEAAAKKFGLFKDTVNEALAGINDKKVNVGIQFKAGSRLAYDLRHQGLADGGLVNGLPGRAGGGVIPGPWRGPKADNVLGVTDAGVPIARVNPREYITRVWATDRMERKHPGALDYINKYGELPGHATGGLAGFASGGLAPGLSFPTSKSQQKAIDDATLDVVASKLDDFRKQITTVVPGSAVAGGGVGMGYKAQKAWALANIPGVIITSTLRTGNPASYHDKGRAIDMVGGPGMGGIFDKIKASFDIPKIAGLYYSPKGDQQVRFGRVMNTPPHIYNTHFDHVHWQMANGGLVPNVARRAHYAGVFDTGGTLNPGRNIVDNFTGAKERLIRPEGLDLAPLQHSIAALGDDIRSLQFRVDGRELAGVVSKHQGRNRQNGGA